MNIHHINLIIKREYLDKLRNPGFIIGTILGVVGIIALSFAPMLFEFLNEQTATKIAIVDRSDLIFPYLPSSNEDEATPEPAPGVGGAGGVGQVSPAQAARVRFIKADTTDLTTLSEQVTKGEISAFIVVQGDTASNVTFDMHSKERPDTTSTSRLMLILGAAAMQAKIEESGISPQQVASLLATPDFKVKPIVGGVLKDEQEVAQAQFLAYALLILLYGTILIYGLQVAMGVVYEKSTRVMEVLITSVRPLELMLGKVIGIGMVGLTQYAFWVASGIAGLVITSQISASQSGAPGGGISLASVPLGTLIYFMVLFLLGYLVYAAIYGALGSLVNKTEDVNSITTPVNLIVIATYLLSLAALGNPDAEYVKILSFVPFFSPMLMFIRVALSNPAPWEPILAVIILIISIFLFTWLAAKIYRVGVLLYGKRPSFREIGRMLRSA